MELIGKRTVKLINEPVILASAGVAGPKESEGPLSREFDRLFSDSMMGEDSFEKAESLLQKRAVELALIKAGKKAEQIDCIYAGDLLNQCIASSFGLREMNIPFVGVYGACSTMALSLINAAIFTENLKNSTAVAVTSSHFCAAERQYRFPLEYGGVRPQTSQWTVTGAGAAVVGQGTDRPKITSFTIGKIVDMGITDQNNMGAAMAPDDVKIRPYPKLEGMVFFYTQIQYLRGLRALFRDFLSKKYIEKIGSKFHAVCESFS